MLQIGNTLVSLQVISQRFCCDLPACLGACCVKGDAGAPLLTAEVDLLNVEYPNIAPFLREEGREAILKQGTWVIDEEDERVTPLIEGAECAYTLFDKGIANCGIEKAWEAGATTFRKPVSCHLYPIRIRKFKQYDAVNYDQWEVCAPARIRGDQTGIPVFRFVREALVLKYGTEWYDELELASNQIDLTRYKF